MRTNAKVINIYNGTNIYMHTNMRRCIACINNTQQNTCYHLHI